MKTILTLTTAIIFFLIFNVEAKTIRNVTICAAKCNSESLSIVNHDEASVGWLYIAPAIPANMENSNVCLQSSKKIQIISNRLSDNSLNACIDALQKKYFGKRVNVITDYSSGSDDEAGKYFLVQENN